METLEQILATLLKTSNITSGAYDTAWLVRLHVRTGCYSNAVQWLRDNQHSDGSWGSTIYHTFDRAICTLSAFVALNKLGQDIDSDRLEHAKRFLNTIHFDHESIDTIAFQILYTGLAVEARDYGLQLDVTQFQSEIDYKIQSLQNYPLMQNSLQFSIEGINHFVDLTLNNAISTSPAATIGNYLITQHNSDVVMPYIDELYTRIDGGLPPVDFVDVYEMVWTITNLNIGNNLKNVDISVFLNRLAQAWRTNDGISYSSRFSVPDLDDTSATFSLLSQFGYKLDARVFEPFEGDSYFHCYINEANPSVSANIRFLDALRYIEHPKREIWVAKSKSAIRSWSNGDYWIDKWHISPYYLTTCATWLINGFLDELIQPKIDWIVDTQQADGGWGHFGLSTLEETAYCVQALALRQYAGHGSYADKLRKARNYLISAPNEYPAMWVSKCLYAPIKIVDAAVYSALRLIDNYVHV